jgi:hypothetical protein
MDAEARAELEALRRRAYGPDADIENDPAALARLVELERRLAPGAAEAPEVAEAADAASTSPSPPPAGIRDESRPASAGPPPAPKHRRPRRWQLALIGGVGLAAMVLGGVGAATTSTRPEAAESRSPSNAQPLPVTVRASSADVGAAVSFATRPDTAVLIRIAIDGSFGSYTNLPAEGLADFGAGDRIRWAEQLGEYYGIELWIVGLEPDGDEHELCIVGELETGDVRARCAPRALWERGALFVTVMAEELSDEERPELMTDAQAIGFWWTNTDTVTVLQGTQPSTR